MPNLKPLAKFYIVFFGLAHFFHLISLMGVNETIVSAPSFLSFWWWHAILFIAYGVLPITMVSVDNETSFLVVTGVSLVEIFAEAFRVFTLIVDFHFILILMASTAVIVSLNLAVENVASKAAAKILSLTWSQF